MASGIARGCVRTTTTTTTTTAAAPKLPKMAAILQNMGCNLGLSCNSLISNIHSMINWHLSEQGIRWPVSRVKFAGSSLQFIEVTRFCKVSRWPSTGFPIWSQAYVRLNCWKQGRVAAAFFSSSRLRTPSSLHGKVRNQRYSNDYGENVCELNFSLSLSIFRGWKLRLKLATIPSDNY